MIKTFGIFAHVDAGKTTLSEQILYLGNTIRKPGRVDQGDSFLDSDRIERERGITIYSDSASFQMGPDTYYLIDTPGHTDFQAACERLTGVLDFAVVVVSAVEGVQAHTLDLWQLLRAAQIPVWIFVNKTDRVHADVPGVLKQLGALTAGRTQLLTEDLDALHYCKAQNDAILQAVVEQDETLLLQYLSDQGPVPYEAFCRQFTALVSAGELVPVIAGSALNGAQVDVLLQNIHRFTVTGYDTDSVRKAPFTARVFRVLHSGDQRVVYLKCLRGQLTARETLGDEKVHQIFAVNGPKLMQTALCTAGMVCAVTGLNRVKNGGWITAGQAGERFEDTAPEDTAPPVLAAGVRFDPAVPVSKVLDVLRRIADEEPAIRVETISEAGRPPQASPIRVQAAGKIQLEVIREICRERYGLFIHWEKAAVVYRETIAQPVVGSGHYEPLRHYAEVHLRLAPGPRGSGITFECCCPPDQLEGNWQRLIETHVFEKEHIGVLTGSVLTDVHVTLLAGRAHLKHTEGGDFREAVYRAIRQGLRSAESILLEPCYAVELTAPQEFVSRIFSDLVQMCGSYELPVPADFVLPGETQVTVRGRVPVRACLGYYDEFMSYTKGRGRMRLRFDGYDQCHNASDVIEEIGYDAERDYEHTADSIFCSHGAGYTVSWREAPEKMHIAVREPDGRGELRRR